MALKEWQIAFNSAKTMETNNNTGAQLIHEYELVLKNIGKEGQNEAVTNVWNEACRNLNELYHIEGDEQKAEFYRSLEKSADEATVEEKFNIIGKD